MWLSLILTINFWLKGFLRNVAQKVGVHRIVGEIVNLYSLAFGSSKWSSSISYLERVRDLKVRVHRIVGRISFHGNCLSLVFWCPIGGYNYIIMILFLYLLSAIKARVGGIKATIL